MIWRFFYILKWVSHCQSQEGSVKHVYFVAESKGNDLQRSQLRGYEESKIECARRHFKAISDNGYIYDVAKDYKSLYDIVTK